MAEICFAMPVLPGKVDLVRSYWAGAGGDRSADAHTQTSTTQITRLLAFLQPTLDGDRLVQYLVAEGSLRDVLARAAANQSDYGRWVQEQFREWSGIDWTRRDAVPNVERLFAWQASPAAATPSGHAIAYTLPIAPSRTAQMRYYWNALQGERAAENDAFLKSIGLTKLQAYLQQTQHGDLLVEYVDSEAGIEQVVGRARQLDSDFARWVGSEFRLCTGFDWHHPETLAIVERLFAWSAS